MKKVLVYVFLGLGLGVGAYATYLVFINIKNARIDARTVSLAEALEELEKSR